MLKKAKGMKVSVYETGLFYKDDECDTERPFILYMVEDDTEKFPCYSFLLTAKGIGHVTDMFGLPKDQNTKKEALDIAFGNLPDYTDIFEKELYEDELVAELEGVWDYRKRHMFIEGYLWEQNRKGVKNE